ncbi:tetratricopeptide repeat protein [Melghirimyces algeriensis]|uniref:Tetratricopeptide repeat-containing protein n=1 Tax=Melghirimyces algeriensis TaxID=910412 RepID=A0A521EJM2_9BACL|nr:tetratricopeptide repeat protein [Melghirimyces algeriensis]SMO84129.1 Tetratricopeptide repeat-containing protein [Melghirimyces algeriensis]
MSAIAIREIGEIIRKNRKEKGFRLEDLADENISSATISNVERGIPYVSLDKVQYLLAKLGIEMDKLPSLLMDEQRENKDLEFKLFAIETMRDAFGNTDDLLKELNGLELEDSHPYAATVWYLKGRCYCQNRLWDKAERALSNGIRLSKQHPYGEKSNIEAACFTELGLCSYHQNNLETALKFTESGLDAFQTEGDRKFIQYKLLRNKAVYLERLGRLNEALQVVQDTWDYLSEIQPVSVVLSLYCLRADLSVKTGLYQEAIEIAKDGLKIAQFDQRYGHLFDLWAILGSAYIKLMEWSIAEYCFRMALKLKDKPIHQHSLIDAYTRLGLMYLKQERWEEAREVIEKAVENGKKLNHVPWLINAYISLGDYYRLQGGDQQAISSYQNAYDLAYANQLRYKEQTILLRLAKCWEKIDEQEFQRCMRNIYKVQEKISEEDDFLENL